MKKLYQYLSVNFRWLLPIILIFITAGQSVQATTSYETNLVVNGDASRGIIDDWNTTNGPTFLDAKSVDLGALPRSGNTDGYIFDYYTGSTSSSTEYITQTIDISDISSAISAGNVKAVLSGYVYRYTTSDVSQIKLEQLDASNNVLETSSAENDGENVWQSKTITVSNLNPSTTKLRVTLYGTLNGGNQAYVEFDQIDLKLYTTPTVTTQAVTNILNTTATGNGNITDFGAPTPSQYGVVWDTNANPTVALSTKTTQGTPSGTGAFTSSITGLNANTTYHVRAYATNTAGTSYGDDVSFTTLTPGTWIGITNTDWATAANWADGSVPTSSTNVTIPAGKTVVIAPSSTADCQNLTVDASGSLTIQSSASETGSLIISGTATGTATAQRYMTTGAWHMTVPPLSGETVADFLTANSNVATSGSNRGMMDYNENSNVWNSFFTNTTSGSLTIGKGYSMRAEANGVVTFTGTPQSGDQSVSTVADKWNCVGNPYTSAIGITSGSSCSANFLTVNAANLGDSYGAVYIWDKSDAYNGLSGNYTAVSNVPGSYDNVQMGQGFFVKMAPSVSSVSFTAAMQLHNTTLQLKSAKTNWATINLIASANNQVSSTIIAFNSAMTKGLDPTYDAGLLKGTADIAVYTRLVEDNGIPFAIQALPDNEYANLIVPVGVDCKTGGDLVFSAQTTNLCRECTVILEDKLTGTFTDLSIQDYLTTASANSSSNGRFYIHTSYLTTDVPGQLSMNEFKLKAYPADSKIIIEGQVGKQANAYVFNINGQKLGQYNLQEGGLNTIDAAGLTSGVYLLRVTDSGKLFTSKIIIH